MSAVLVVAMFFFLVKFSSIEACLYFSARIVYDFVTCSFVCVSFLQEGGLVWQQSTLFVMCVLFFVEIVVLSWFTLLR